METDGLQSCLSASGEFIHWVFNHPALDAPCAGINPLIFPKFTGLGAVKHPSFPEGSCCCCLRFQGSVDFLPSALGILLMLLRDAFFYLHS